MSQLSRWKFTRIRKTVEETVWRDELTTICRSESPDISIACRLLSLEPYIVLDTVLISGEDVCCSVMCGTLVGVSVFNVIWSELLMTSAISFPLVISVLGPKSGVWYVYFYDICIPLVYF